jgi:phosphoribosylformimino-5-aminoimidazole carboxamide ribotide isomerase
MSLQIIPVMDLKNGQVVQGVAGRREEYKPIQSLLTHSSRPLEVAKAIREHFGLNEIYLADLNAIAGEVPAFSLYADLNAAGFRLWVDAGSQNSQQATSLVQAGVATIVLGLETLDGPKTLARACQEYGERIIFSLDLKHGMPLGNLESWGDGDPWTIANIAWQCGVRRLLLLDLSSVGMSGGIGTEELAKRLLTQFPELSLTVGGGIRHCEDLMHLKGLGISAALVSTALHRKAILPEHLPLLA